MAALSFAMQYVNAGDSGEREAGSGEIVEKYRNSEIGLRIAIMRI
jgi:hypothetical protein